MKVIPFLWHELNDRRSPRVAHAMPFQLLERKTRFAKKEFHYYCIWQPLVTRGYVFFFGKKSLAKRVNIALRSVRKIRIIIPFRNSVNSRWQKSWFYREMQMIMYDYNFFGIFFSKPFFSYGFRREKIP